MFRIPTALKIWTFIFLLGALSSFQGIAQSLNLKIFAETETESDSLQRVGYKETFEDFNSLEIEVKAFAEKILTLGYLESELKSLNKPNDSTYTATFHLGKLYTMAIINYDDAIDIQILRLISPVMAGQNFEIEIPKLESALQTLNQHIANLVDPFSTLQLVNVKMDDHILRADLKLVKNNPRSIDSIIIKGYERFPKSFIKRYLKIKQNESFNLNVIKKKTEALENLPFASQLKNPEVLFTKDSTLLYIYLQKQRSNSFDGFIGFGTNTETDKIEFDGYLNLNLTNNLNYGESFRLIYKSDESEQKTFDANLKLPYILGSPLGSQLGLNIFKKDSAFVTTSQFAKLEYQINPKNNISMGVNLQASSNLLENPIVTIGDFKSTFYTIGYQYVTPENYDPLFPINYMFDIAAATGRRVMESKNQSQVKLQLTSFKIFNLNYRNSIYGQFQAAIINSADFVENEMFRFGGINSIRGFEENSLIANIFGVLNTEYRYKVSPSLYMNSILDFAYYENELIATKSKLFSVGFGFGLLTKAGLLKLNYSNGNSNGQPFKISNSKIHISLAAVF